MKQFLKPIKPFIPGNFKIRSFDENGKLILNVTEQPAFYGLFNDGKLIGYFTSVESARLAVEDIREAELAA